MNDLREEIEVYRPNILIAMGKAAMWMLTGETAISQFRGYVIPCTLVPGIKVVPTYSIKSINDEWKF